MNKDAEIPFWLLIGAIGIIIGLWLLAEMSIL
jgi:hypothetical protein